MKTDAYEIIGGERPAPWLVTCDHAENRVPPSVADGDLGLSEADMARHIAWDVGARGVSVRLAERLNGPMIATRFSRLAIDPNRGEDDPTLIMKLYDGTIIPGNRTADGDERARRIEMFYRPYHDALAHLAARRSDTILVSIHSFTPQLRTRPPRPWHVAVLYDPRDQRLSRPLIDRLQGEPDLCVGDNEPYTGALEGDALNRHGIRAGRPHVLIEVRNDLIRTPEDQAAWGDRLAPLLEAARRDAGL